MVAHAQTQTLAHSSPVTVVQALPDSTAETVSCQDQNRIRGHRVQDFRTGGGRWGVGGWLSPFPKFPFFLSMGERIDKWILGSMIVLISEILHSSWMENSNVSE